MNEKRPALPALTGLRFFAALWVVLYHIEVFWCPAFIPDQGIWQPVALLVRHGSLGVNVFFVLSGFILTYNYAAPDGSVRGGIGAYCLARIARIYPLYLTVLLFALGPFTWGEGSLAPTGPTVFSTLTLTDTWCNPPLTAWAGPGWSLSCEALFYALLPLLLVSLARLRPRGVLIVAAVAWSAALLPMTVWSNTMPPLRLPEFVVGMAAGRLFLAWRPAPVRATTPCVLLLAGILVTALLIMPASAAAWYARGLLDPLIAALLIQLATQEGVLARLLAARPAQHLGQISYALFLVHWPLWAWYTHLLGGHDMYLRVHGPVLYTVLGCYGVVAVLVAQWLYVGVEEPMRRTIRSWTRSRSSFARAQLHCVQESLSVQIGPTRPGHVP
jgi:peptidoglycan/LPS O-acetylase OafA/YrhL